MFNNLLQCIKCNQNISQLSSSSLSQDMVSSPQIIQQIILTTIIQLQLSWIFWLFFIISLLMQNGFLELRAGPKSACIPQPFVQCILPPSQIYFSIINRYEKKKCIKHGQVYTALNQVFRHSVSYEVGLRCTNQVVVSVQVSQMPQVNCCKHAINYH